MAAEYTGIFKIGHKAAGEVSHVQVNDVQGRSAPMPVADYVKHGIMPDFQSLPWGAEGRRIPKDDEEAAN